MEEHSNRQRTPYLFTGKELDEDTGLYYYGARYYDPRTSVWQSPDPILGDYMLGERSGTGVYTPRNLNLFSYSHQRPIVMMDPDGLEVGKIDWDRLGLFTTAGAAGGAAVGATAGTACTVGAVVCSPIGAGAAGFIGGAGGFIAGVGTEVIEESSPYIIAGAQWMAGAVGSLWNSNAQSGPTFDQGMIALAQQGEQIRSTEGTPGQVRVQLQQGNNNISSISLAAPTGSVSKLQAQGGLAYVFMDGSTRDPSLFTNSGFGGAIARASAKIQSLPPGGMVKGPYATSIQELFTHNGRQYRIDVEILRGTQLVE